MRFTLIERFGDDEAQTVSAPGLRAWRRRKPGVSDVSPTRRPSAGLAGGGDYRARSSSAGSTPTATCSRRLAADSRRVPPAGRAAEPRGDRRSTARRARAARPSTIVTGDQPRQAPTARDVPSSCSSTARPPTSATSTRSRRARRARSASPGPSASAACAWWSTRPTRSRRRTRTTTCRSFAARVCRAQASGAPSDDRTMSTETMTTPPKGGPPAATPASAVDGRGREDAPIGGQAVLEGVMMRGVSTWAVAVRKPSPEQLERTARPRPHRGRARRDRGHLRAARLARQAPPRAARCRSSAASSRSASR